MKVVIALGGNALLERGERPDSGIQEQHVASAVAALAPVLHQHDMVITHGNGPQVGVLALESARDRALSRPYPFDVLGAQTQGMIGYWVVQALSRAAGSMAQGQSRMPVRRRHRRHGRDRPARRRPGPAGRANRHHRHARTLLTICAFPPVQAILPAAQVHREAVSHDV